MTRILSAQTLAIALVVIGISGCASTVEISTQARVGTSDPNRPSKVPAGLNEPPRATGADRAFRWRKMAWLDENGEFSLDAVRRAREARAANIEWTKKNIHPGGVASGASWREHGPSNVGGRTRSVVINAPTPTTLLAGSVSGGIWRSVDAGANWSPVDEWMDSIAICCIAAAPSSSSIVYAGTGEGYFNGDAIGGAGIYKSTDAGLTWQKLQATSDWGNTNRIAVSPTNPNVLLAGVFYGGIMRSLNGGLTWTTSHWAQGGMFVAFHPTDPSRAIATELDYDAGGWFYRAIYTTNGGDTWQTASGLSHVGGWLDRLELEYNVQNPSIVFAVNALDGKVWRSDDGGAHYVSVTTTGSTGTSWYCAPIWSHPSDPQQLLAGGGAVTKSSDGGATMTTATGGDILTEQPHPDIHYFQQDPGWNGTTNRKLYVCTDGGVFVAEDLDQATNTTGWRSLVNNYRTTQFYGAAGVARAPWSASQVQGTVPELTVRYYALSGSPQVLPNFSTITPFLTSTIANVNIAETAGVFAGSGLSNLVAATFDGWINVPSTDLYTLSLYSDDGSRLLIDGAEVVNHDGLHPMSERFGSVALVAGKHAIRIEFFENGGGAGLIARIEGGGLDRQAIPATMFSRGGTVTGVVTDPNPVLVLVGGTQDNGTLRVTDRDSRAVLDFGGDGGFCEIDQTNPNYVYGEYIGLRIHRSTDGGRSASYIYSGITDIKNGLANFIAPFILDPNDQRVMLAGGRSLWRTTDVRASTVLWSAISPAFDANISAIAVNPSNSNRILVALNNGMVMSTSNGQAASPTWTAIDDNGSVNPFPARYIQRVVFDPSIPLRIYVAIPGFSSDNLWRSNDDGATWTVVQGQGASSLPPAPMRTFAVHPDNSNWLYAGTEFGLFTSTDGGVNWSTNLVGPTAVSIDEARFIPNTRTLLLATHGRGLWTSDELFLSTPDMNGDGCVNGADLATFLSRWGIPTPPGGPGDFTGDGVVDGLDFAFLISAWDPCG